MFLASGLYSRDHRSVRSDGVFDLRPPWILECSNHHYHPWARYTNNFSARKSNSIETSRCRNAVVGHHIATNICTCHDSTAVVPCTKLCSDHGIRVEVRVKRNFHRIWIAMEKPLVKRGPDPILKFSHPVPVLYSPCRSPAGTGWEIDLAVPVREVELPYFLLI